MVGQRAKSTQLQVGPSCHSMHGPSDIPLTRSQVKHRTIETARLTAMLTPQTDMEKAGKRGEGYQPARMEK